VGAVDLGQTGRALMEGPVFPFVWFSLFQGWPAMEVMAFLFWFSVWFLFYVSFLFHGVLSRLLDVSSSW
jgi:hypothetical protein